MINNIYHKKALELFGYKTNTFVSHVYFITSEFDFIADKEMSASTRKHFKYSSLLNYALYNHNCLYFYFTGGVLGEDPFFAKFEPYFLKLAKVKTVVLPFGGDIHEMSLSKNLHFKNAMSKDYPLFKFNRRTVLNQIDRWTTKSDHVVSGCDWVEYMYHWDTIMLAHFSIDTDRWAPLTANELKSRDKNSPLKVLHAPNHKNIKGTRHFENAIAELQQEGLNIELVIRQKAPNEEIKRTIMECDVIADQLLIGWYAMFALEAMSMEKPVLCFIKQDLENLYIEEGLIKPGEIPLINCTPLTIKETLRDLYFNREKLPEIGKLSREYVLKHHSLAAVGKVFNEINKKINLQSRLI